MLEQTDDQPGAFDNYMVVKDWGAIRNVLRSGICKQRTPPAQRTASDTYAIARYEHLRALLEAKGVRITASGGHANAYRPGVRDTRGREVPPPPGEGITTYRDEYLPWLAQIHSAAELLDEQQKKVHDDSSALLLLRKVPDGITKGEIEAFFGTAMSGFIKRNDKNEPEINFDTRTQTATVVFINVGYAYTALNHCGPEKLLKGQHPVKLDGPITAAACRGGSQSPSKWGSAGDEPARSIPQNSGCLIGPPPGHGAPIHPCSSHGPPAAPQDNFADEQWTDQDALWLSQLCLNSTLGDRDGREQQQEQEQNSSPGGSAAASAPSPQQGVGTTTTVRGRSPRRNVHHSEASEAKSSRYNSSGIDLNDI